MGREIRRVPPHWKHPRIDCRHFIQCPGGDCFQPMFNKQFDESDDNPFNREFYRPYKDEEATWFQVYETVSEGTPVTPPFSTKEELVDYLVNNGDFWDQHRGRGGYTKEQARAFVFGDGWAPSFVIIRNENGVTIKQGIECCDLK